jgi:hypothetical protein
MILAALLAVTAALPPAQLPRPNGAGHAANEQQASLLLGSPQLASALGALRIEIGAWAEYLVQTRGDQDVRVRFSVVPPAPGGGRAWVEVTALGSESLPFAVRLLFVAATGKMERAVVHALGQAPLEIPFDSDANGRRPDSSPPGSVHVALAGVEQVTVPAGTFRATKVRARLGRESVGVWKSEAVPLWGLVRARDARRRIELLRYAHTGARSVFPPAQGNGSESANE